MPPRIRLVRDAFLLPAEDGARILDHRGVTALSGATIHEWLRRLAPHLDGSTTLDELVSGLPEDKRAMVEQVVEALSDAGLVRSGEAPSDDAIGGYLDSLVDDAGAAERRFRHARVVVVGTGDLAEEVIAVLRRAGIARVDAGPCADADLVISLLTDLDADLDADLHDGGVPAIRVVVRGDRLWICPGDWEPARRGLARRPAGAPSPVEGVAAVVAASMIGTAALRLLAGVGDAATRTLTRLHLPTLRGTTHDVLPSAPPTGSIETLDRLESAPATEDTDLDVAGYRLVDPEIGVFAEVSGRDIPQLPLSVVAASVAGWSRPAIGAGATPSLARRRAVLRGIALHQVSTVDPSRLVDGRVVGYRMSRRDERLLDVATVFVPPDGEVGSVAAGRTWSEAVSAALLDLCARETARVPGRCVRLDPADLGGDEEAAAYRAMLDILGVAVEVYDVTGPLGLPTLAYRTGGRTVTYASAPHPRDTVAPGLRAVLLADQAARHGASHWAPPPVPQLDPASPTFGSPPAASSPAAVVDALTASGREPVVVPLDHDRQVADLVPHVARVILDA